MINAVVLTVALLLAAWLAFSPRVSRSSNWKATVTPLASIMGSGFLVSAPLLGGLVGNLALPCMAILLALAYGLGGVLRFNIRHFEPIEHERGSAQRIAFVSRVVLAGAYFISVSYYLQLLASFLLNAFGHDDPLLARGITSVVLAIIGGVGILRGLGLLEKVEGYAISLNLGAIGALLVALLIHNARLAGGGDWVLPDVPSDIDGTDLRKLLGLLIVVQGFETSRYLGDEHPAAQRIATMRTAQLASSAIYLVFIGLVTVLFHPDLGADVTAVIDLTRPVALVLPVLLTIAAIGSQFTAAVADEAGAGGLIADLSGRRLSLRHAYVLILVVTLALTWVTDVHDIIAYASRAFALYYGLQCVVALFVNRSKAGEARHGLTVGFLVLALLSFGVFLLGLPAE